MNDVNDKPRARFDMLDGLRGIAAIAVMVYHYSQHTGLPWLSGAWVAVDLFFILSGLVIAYSYSAKINAGMPFVEFLKVRLIRLGPLYLFGLVLGLVAALMVPAAKTQINATQLWTAALLGAGGLPYFHDAAWSLGHDSVRAAIFPLNNPAWSLFFELVVNALFFAYIRKFARPPGAIAVALCVLAFVAITLRFHQLNPGWNTSNFIFGFPRVVAEFFAGALMYSIGCHLRRYSKYTVAVVAFAAIAGLFGGGGYTALLNSVTLIPATVWLLSATQVSGKARTLCKFLGDLSYPVYMLHFPVFHLCTELFSWESENPMVQTLLISALSLGIAVLAMHGDFKLRQRITSA